MSKDGTSTVRMQRGNRQITVFDHEVKKYADKGYSLTSEVRAREGRTLSTADMEKIIKQHEDRISDLEQTVKGMIAKVSQKPKKPRQDVSAQ